MNCTGAYWGSQIELCRTASQPITPKIPGLKDQLIAHPTTDTFVKQGPPAATKSNRQQNPAANRSRRLALDLNRKLSKNTLSKAQLTAFLAKVEANPTLKLQVDEASDATAVAAIAQAVGFLFSPASLARHLRGLTAAEDHLV